jgi:hypothetical protein
MSTTAETFGLTPASVTIMPPKECATNPVGPCCSARAYASIIESRHPFLKAPSRTKRITAPMTAYQATKQRIVGHRMGS